MDTEGKRRSYWILKLRILSPDGMKNDIGYQPAFTCASHQNAGPMAHVSMAYNWGGYKKACMPPHPQGYKKACNPSHP